MVTGSPPKRPPRKEGVSILKSSFLSFLYTVWHFKFIWTWVLAPENRSGTSSGAGTIWMSIPALQVIICIREELSTNLRHFWWNSYGFLRCYGIPFFLDIFLTLYVYSAAILNQKTCRKLMPSLDLWGIFRLCLVFLFWQ